MKKNKITPQKEYKIQNQLSKKYKIFHKNLIFKSFMKVNIINYNINLIK